MARAKKVGPLKAATTNDINTTIGTGATDAQAAINASAKSCLLIGERRVYIAETAAQVWAVLNPTTGVTPQFAQPTIVAIVPSSEMPPLLRVYTPGQKRGMATRLIDFVIAPTDIEWALAVV